MQKVKELLNLEQRLKEAKAGWRKNGELLTALQVEGIDTTQVKTAVYVALTDQIHTLRNKEQEEAYTQISQHMKVLEGTAEGKGIQLHRAGDFTYITLQKVFSHHSNYAIMKDDQWHPKGDKRNKALLEKVIMGIKIDYKRIPPSFWTRHGITAADGPDAVKKIFLNSQKLGYIDEKYKHTARILYPEEGTVLSRRTNKKLMKFINPTAAEKRKYELQHLLNTYQDEFSAVRAQKYITEKARTGADFYRGIKKHLLKIMNKILSTTTSKEKDTDGQGIAAKELQEIKQKIAAAKASLEDAQNYHATKAVTRMLSKRTTPTNKLYMRLYGADNDISKRISELSHMFLQIELQTDGMEHRLEKNKAGMDRLRNNLLTRDSWKTTPEKQQQYIEHMLGSTNVKFPQGNITQPWKGYIDQLKRPGQVEKVWFSSLIVLQKIHAQTYDRQEVIAHGKGDLTLALDEGQQVFDELLGITEQFDKLTAGKESELDYQEQKKILEELRNSITEYIEVIINT